MSIDMTLLDILSEAEESFTCRSGMINPYVVTVDMKNNGRNLRIYVHISKTFAFICHPQTIERRDFGLTDL